MVLFITQRNYPFIVFASLSPCCFLATVDLSDESGNLKYLVDHPLNYASEFLKERESFVLIKVESKFN